MKSYKVVLTGGPCGGKTKSLEILKKNLKYYDLSVITISETASDLLSMGYAPGCNISYFDFQNILFKIQFIKEYINEKNVDIAICDRGLLDAKIYIDNEEFNNLLILNQVKENEILDTYNVALYFRTIAYEFPDIFQQERIYEVPSVGIMRDKRSLEAWKSKILHVSYSNFDGYENKIMSIYGALKDHIVVSDTNKSKMLSDYYSQEIISFLLLGLEKIMNQNKISDEIKVRTRRLIK